VLAAILGLLGAGIYGSADFLGGLAAKRLRSIVVTAVSAAAGEVLLIVGYPILGGTWSTADLGWSVLAGLFGASAVGLLYACLAIGPMSILSPLTAVVSAITPMLWGLLVNGEELGALGYVGLGVALVAVVLVGFIPGQHVVRPSLRAILMAVGSGLAIGGFLISIDQTADDSGITPLIISRGTSTLITSIVAIAILVIGVRRGLTARQAVSAGGAQLGATPTGHADLEHARPHVARGATATASAWWLAIACGLTDTVANSLMLVALRLGDLAVVSVLTAMYPAGTIVLAAIVLKERIAPVQWLGLALALVAAGMLALS
jgi:drug/metabolite transporter (DMT)-like permease